MKKILIVGVDWLGNDPVSQIVKNAFLSSGSKEAIYFFGLGEKNGLGKVRNITYKTLKDPYFSKASFFFRLKRKIAETMKYDTFLFGSRFCYSRLLSFAKQINPDLIVALSGPMFYMESSVMVSKKLGISLNEVFFDPCSNNPDTVNFKKRRNRELWWFSEAKNIFFDSANDVPNETIPKIRTFRIPVNPKGDSSRRDRNVLIYGGGFYKGFREPYKLAEFSKIAKKQGFVLKAFVRGEYGKEILKASGAEVHDEIPNDAFVNEVSRAEAVVVLGNSCKNKYSPSKIIDGINNRKPIITIDVDLKDIPFYPFIYDWKTSDLFEKIKTISIDDLNNFDVFEKYPFLSVSYFCNLITQ